MTFLLDTDVCVDVLRGTHPEFTLRLRENSPGDVRLSCVTRAELAYGARRSLDPAAALRLVDRFLEPFETLPFDDAAADAYGRIRADLATRGQMIGANDLAIAATGVARGLVVVTRNTREFERVIGLHVEDWSRAGVRP